jgi:hypothetical protein
LPPARPLQAPTRPRGSRYTPARTFLAAADNGAVGPVASPSPAADWQVAHAGGGAFTLTPASPSKGATPFGSVGGFIDGHMHWMTFEYLGGNFDCGKPWDAYGIP